MWMNSFSENQMYIIFVASSMPSVLKHLGNHLVRYDIYNSFKLIVYTLPNLTLLSLLREDSLETKFVSGHHRLIYSLHKFWSSLQPFNLRSSQFQWGKLIWQSFTTKFKLGNNMSFSTEFNVFWILQVLTYFLVRVLPNSWKMFQWFSI